MRTDFMASAKQIKARKAFVKKYAKKGKRGKSKKAKTKSRPKKTPINKLKVSDIGDYMTPIKKPEFFENKDKGKYMILQGTNTQYPMPYRDPFTGRQLVDSLDSVQRVAFLLDAQGEKVQIISS